MLVGLGLGIAEVFPEHIADVADGAHIGRKLILHLHHVLCLAAYLALTLAAKFLADHLHGGDDDTVEEVVALYVEICGVGGYSEVEERLLSAQVLVLHIGVFPLEFIDLDAHLVMQFFKHLV